MQKSALIRFGTLAALVGAAACADGTLVSPDAATTAASGPERAAAASVVSGASFDADVSVSPLLGQINTQLAASGAHLAVQKAELLVDANTWDGVSSTVLIANNRSRGIGAEWVAGDPRRDGRVGVTYAFGSSHPSLPLTRNPDGSNLHAVPLAQLDTQIEEALTAWRAQSCLTAPITRVSIPAGTDPDYLDDLFRTGAPSATYSQPSDIVEAGWAPLSFFRTIAGASGSSIIGITFTFIFTDASGNPTDIDRDGNEDTALAEIYYNTGFAWGTTQALNVVDFYSIITHETGHALGLAHFGKVFVTKKDAADGVSVVDVKYAPKAMMNAVYVTGRGEIAGTDNSSFCQIWASKK
jgi:hypothetical protein